MHVSPDVSGNPALNFTLTLSWNTHTHTPYCSYILIPLELTAVIKTKDAFCIMLNVRNKTQSCQLGQAIRSVPTLNYKFVLQSHQSRIEKI